MKITALVSEKSKQGKLTLRTDPPITVEVLALVKKHAPDYGVGFDLSMEDGFLIFPQAIPQQFLPTLERIFTDAENSIKDKKNAEEQARKNFLKNAAASLGLPLE